MGSPESNPTIESLMTTRAIRRFTSDAVSDDELRHCLRAAQQAPSGGNVQPQQYLVVTDPQRRAAVARWYRAAFDRYEATLPEPTEFRDEAQAASWRRTRDASRYLADHLDEAPALVLFLQPLIPWTPRDDDGEMDIGRLDASVYPAVQNFCVAARSLGSRHGADDRHPHPHGGGAGGARRAGGAVRDRRPGPGRPPGRPVRRGAAQAGRRRDALGRAGATAATTRDERRATRG